MFIINYCLRSVKWIYPISLKMSWIYILVKFNLVPFLNDLEDDEGLGILSEHAGESAHSAF